MLFFHKIDTTDYVIHINDSVQLPSPPATLPVPQHDEIVVNELSVDAWRKGNTKKYQYSQIFDACRDLFEVIQEGPDADLYWSFVPDLIQVLTKTRNAIDKIDLSEFADAPEDSSYHKVMREKFFGSFPDEYDNILKELARMDKFYEKEIKTVLDNLNWAENLISQSTCGGLDATKRLQADLLEGFGAIDQPIENGTAPGPKAESKDDSILIHVMKPNRIDRLEKRVSDLEQQLNQVLIQNKQLKEMVMIHCGKKVRVESDD